MNAIIREAVSGRAAVSGTDRPRDDAPPKPAPTSVKPGRVTVDSRTSSFTSAFTIINPPGPDEFWRYQQLDEANLDLVDPIRLTEVLTNLSPDISRAFWDYLRLSNNGYSITALNYGSDEPNPEGQAIISAVIARLDLLYGSAESVWNRLFAGDFMRGMQLAEGIFDSDGETLVDIAVPDPASLRFRKEIDPIRGEHWQIGQLQVGAFVPLTSPTIRWVALDPLPGNPYGRPMIAPAVYTAVFLLSLLHDLRRVVSTQGYPRMDIEILLENVKASAPPIVQSDATQFRTWVEDILREVEDAYAALAVDDAYIHTDNVKMNQPVGAANSQAFTQIMELIERVERMSARALKTMPVLMGLREVHSEAQANRQWEIMSAGIKAVQHGTENVISGIFTLALEAAGVPARAECRFAELRVAELLRDAQVEQIQFTNLKFAYQAGWISQEEASEKAVHHPPAEDEPRTPEIPESPASAPSPGPGGGAPEPSDGGADPGANRLNEPLGPWQRLLARFTPKPGGTPAEPDPVSIEDADLIAAAKEWDDMVEDETYQGMLDAAVTRE